MTDASEHDATLKTLTTSPGEVSHFWSARKLYTVFVAHEVEKTAITATPSAPGATLTLDGAPLASDQASPPITLACGRNQIEVEVTAADGTTKDTYTVKVLRSYPTVNWVKDVETCPWSPRDSAGELVFRDRMWLFGGYTPAVVNDVWSSADGLNWEPEAAIPCESGVNIPATFVYDDKMWVVSQVGKLFASTDGNSWSLVNDRPPCQGRYAAGALVFKDRMWLLGGAGSGQFFNDLWSSTDGVDWTLETEEAPWSRRQLFSMVAVHEGKMWIMGGGITNYHPFKAYRDVWSSPDGRNWTKVTDCAPWPARIWSSSVTYKNRLWVLTGFRAEPTWNNFNDVWYSADGAHWNQLVTEAIWEPRHEVSLYVFKDRLWAVGGNAWPLMNDVWHLEIGGLMFLSQPVVEEFATTQYTYRARADFNESCGPVRYRLLGAPDWLTVDADSGLVRGTPPSGGDVEVTVEAFDDAGETARQTYTLHVLGG